MTLTEIPSFSPGLVELLGVVRRRALELGIGLHLLDLGGSGLRELLDRLEGDVST